MKIGITTLENNSAWPTKLEDLYIEWHINCILGQILWRNPCKCDQKMYKNIHCNHVWSSKNMWKIEMPIDNQMDCHILIPHMVLIKYYAVKTRNYN